MTRSSRGPPWIARLSGRWLGCCAGSRSPRRVTGRGNQAGVPFNRKGASLSRRGNHAALRTRGPSGRLRPMDDADPGERMRRAARAAALRRQSRPRDRLDVPQDMRKFSLEALGRQLLERAGAAGGGHTADTVVGGHERILRQTVIAMLKGAVLAEHENPGEATVHVLSGRVRLAAGDVSWEGRPSDPLVVPDARHGPRPVKGAFRADRSRS
jgi:hypothetical protein